MVSFTDLFVIAVPFYAALFVAMWWVRREYLLVKDRLSVSKKRAEKPSRETMIAEYNNYVSNLSGVHIHLTVADDDAIISERFTSVQSRLNSARKARLINAALHQAGVLMSRKDTRNLLVSPIGQKIGYEGLDENPIVNAVFDIIAGMLASGVREPSLSEYCDLASPN